MSFNVDSLKPLKWSEPYEGAIWAQSPFGGIYTIWIHEDDPRCRVSLRNDEYKICDTLDHAKEVVEEHHISKVSALFED